MESAVKQRLIDYIEYKKISKNKFETEAGLSKRYVSNIEKSIQPDKVERISIAFPDLNMGWVLTGSGEMLKTNVPITKTSPEALPLIPFEALAGHLSADNEGISYEDCEQYVIPEFKRQGAEFIIRVSGSSMYPKYSNGDLLGCRIIREMLFFQWGKIYVIDTSQGTLVKRIYQHENEDYVTLVSDNKEHYPPFAIPKTDIRSLSIVVGVVRLE